ncbi:hypothetical protein [Arthrobacter sp. SO3]|uniref:hypothetical protein n=1 Tax=Arthrobacter sp. SO3 TaxID=1897057 RepID=UPI001CFF999F|nr:hypothetical protein [Arthrobacter sp. SO3]MCB5292004.1 hypothetical protein [Arthrobacter sp. SO3]
MRNIHAGKSIRRVAVGMLAVAAFLVPAPLASAARADPAGRDDRPRVSRLPGATGAEGIAAGDGSTFFAGDLLNGNIFRGDIDKGKAKLFITAPEGRAAVGMKVDRENDLLFVAGGATGQAYVYDLETKKTVKVYDLAPAGASFINDVTVTHDLNGIAAAKDGHRLIVAHTGRGALYRVDPDDGSNITSGNFDVPTTAALSGNTVALVNAKFATPAATSFEVVLVRACHGG